MNHLFYCGIPLFTKMTDEWAKYRKILEREDEEFKKAMEAKVSTLLFPKFSSQCRILVGIDIIAHSSLKFAIFNFHVMLISFSMMIVRFRNFNLTLGFGSYSLRV